MSVRTYDLSNAHENAEMRALMFSPAKLRRLIDQLNDRILANRIALADAILLTPAGPDADWASRQIQTASWRRGAMRRACHCLRNNRRALREAKAELLARESMAIDAELEQKAAA